MFEYKFKYSLTKQGEWLIFCSMELLTNLISRSLKIDLQFKAFFSSQAKKSEKSGGVKV